jgi:hypothetical protein
MNTMKSWILLIIIGMLSGVSLSVQAQEGMLVSRSIGKLVQDESIELTTEVRKQDLVITGPPDQEQTRDTTSTRIRQGQAGIANRYDQYFTIYDASVSLLSDLDGDGYHHAINLFFDVDVSDESATVYAKLYLSRDGGPWLQYYTTDWFNIYGDSYSDAYEVTTELLEGYAPGYYDILIEVFSLNHADMVASQVLDSYYLGRDTMLEDLSRDEIYYYEENYYSHGAGSFSLVWLLLIVQVVIAARGAVTLISET